MFDYLFPKKKPIMAKLEPSALSLLLARNDRVMSLIADLLATGTELSESLNGTSKSLSSEVQDFCSVLQLLESDMKLVAGSHHQPNELILTLTECEDIFAGLKVNIRVYGSTSAFWRWPLDSLVLSQTQCLQIHKEKLITVYCELLR